jgi:hypothetical protein
MKNYRITKKILLLICLFFTFSNMLVAQSIIGTWKTVSNVVVNLDGTKSDITAMQLKQWPCMADLHTIFDANGKQYMKSEKKCGPIDYNKLAVSTWKMSGATISITNTSMPNPLGNTSTYSVAFSGNTATFTHVYTDQERVKLHSKKVKEIVITYQRVS